MKMFVVQTRVERTLLLAYLFLQDLILQFLSQIAKIKLLQTFAYYVNRNNSFRKI